jgi:hypothetical protein
MSKEPSELQEQIAGVAWVRRRSIFICSIENSLHFPLQTLKQQYGNNIVDTVRKIIFKLVQQRKQANM